MSERFWARPILHPGPVLTPNEVHVWSVRTDDPTISRTNLDAFLSSAERDRAAKFKFESDRRRFVLAHAALRSILSLYVKRRAVALEFETGPYGKPKLSAIHSSRRVTFNLSHSHLVALIAVAKTQEIGVDVEWMRKDFAFGDVAERFFTSKEVAALHSLPKDFQREAFYKCWTSKEAFLKAKGTGLSGNLDEVEINFLSNAGVRVNGTIPNWTLVELNPYDGYVGALVMPTSAGQFKCFRWQGP